MTQETRKERRVKIVSLNVRYRSATLEEFIENHAHDVSRGGIFIKAANPFPPGTLLKFEIRLVNDQAVISGVGRVVWKRDAGAAVGDSPSGMGVKFIKLDEPSKAVIDRLVSTKADAGTAFETESGEAPSAAPPAPSSQTHRGRPPPPPPHGAMAVPTRKPTMIGVGAPAAGVGSSVRSSVPPRPSTPAGSPSGTLSAGASERPAAPMFPRSDFAEETTAVTEPTLMKQAAELLEEALREAGGSLAEVGSNPLFARRGESSADTDERGSQAETKIAPIAAVAGPREAVAPSPIAADKPHVEAPKAQAREAPKSDRRDLPKAHAASTPGSAQPAPQRSPSRRGLPVGALLAVTAALVAAGAGVAVIRRHHQPAAAVQPPPAVPSPVVTAAPPPPKAVESIPSSMPVAVAVPTAPSSPPSASAAPSAPRPAAGAAPRAVVPVAARQRPKPPAAEGAASSAVPVNAVGLSAEAVSPAASGAAAPTAAAPTAAAPTSAAPTAAAPTAAAPTAAAPTATANDRPSPPPAAAAEPESKAATSKPKAPAAPKKSTKAADDNPY
ncbi:MAG: TIGR02266 family protein [Polyangiaceae bacterium]